ncbi:cell adhesion molecule CEACAM8 [Callithrix jacchus]|uniref:Ig-like domain-containing protein n=1 Tax=Callithrix jacchus TaxID=9483 RepID=A0A5F4W538_CALJA|nr:carcinoembryonic antigen-related cell adhesion molecule 8 [Callithrix jacchus]XP_008986324.2 carcinoembryonic antigen-related cell adhesion molecule 8 [Callithrix jacchus]
MRPPSAPSHRWRIPWQRFLLIASLLTFWNLPTSAQLTIESIPSNAAEGEEVLLLTHNVSQDTAAFNWYKGERVDRTRRIMGYVIAVQQTIQGPAYSGRETINPNVSLLIRNVSLLIRNVTLSDTGFYTLQVIKGDLTSEETTVQFRVYSELSKPNITSNNSRPVENKDAVALTCEPETQDTTYLWWVNGQSLPVSPRLQLSSDNRTLTLLSVTRNDTGPYECGIQNPVSANRSDPVTLNVLYGPDTPIISPPDSSYRSGANLNLSCHSASNPTPTYSWYINGTLQSHTQVLFIPQITSNHTAVYGCFVSNSATRRYNSTVKTITVSVPGGPVDSAGTTVSIMTGVLAGVALIAALV